MSCGRWIEILLLSLLSTAVWAQEIAPEAVDPLIEKLASLHWQQREQAVWQLVALGQQAKPHLQHTLASSTHPEMRYNLKRVLCYLHWEVTPEIMNRMGETMQIFHTLPWRVRREKVLLLEDFCGEEAINTLLVIVREDPVEQVRIVARRSAANLSLQQKNAMIFAYLQSDLPAQALAEIKNVLAIDPAHPQSLFLAARVYARLNDIDLVCHYLGKAVDAGFAQVQDIVDNPDFQGLRHDPRFTRILRMLHYE